jgi:hypothetical protein
MRLHYLDATNEPGSAAILRELSVVVSKFDSGSFLSSDSLSLLQNADLLRERKYPLDVSYVARKGYPYLDIRDSGDCWLRLFLEPNDLIKIPAHLYHKFCPDGVNDASLGIFDSFRLPLNEGICVYRFSEIVDTLRPIEPHSYRELICELCSQFYEAGWVTGTGGSISIRYGNRIFMTPSGVQKERILPDELFMLDIDGNILSVPPQKTVSKRPKLSDCSPLFLHSYRLCKAGISATILHILT